MGILIGNDATLLRERFKEMAHLLGIECLYCEIIPATKRYDTHIELNANYKDPIPLDIIFEEYPNQKTLKKLGWFSEDSENKPLLAQLPYDTPGLQSGCLLLIPAAINGEYKPFRITEVSNGMVFPDCFYVKLAPEFRSKLDNTLDKDYEENNFNYLSGDDGTR
jgi:hypothetical protein